MSTTYQDGDQVYQYSDGGLEDLGETPKDSNSEEEEDEHS